MLYADILDQSFLTNFEHVFQEALVELEKNTISSELERNMLKASLQLAHDELLNKGVFERSGTDEEWRAATVITQGLLEQSMTKTVLSSCDYKVEATVLTPRMPTPLMLGETVDLSSIDLAKPSDFAKYRSAILQEFLNAGCTLNAVYSHDAKTALADKESLGLAIYAANVDQHKSLNDKPIISIAMKDFPAEFTGATYNVNGCPIAVESKQVTQIDNKSKTWSIKIGIQAEERAKQVNGFIAANSRSIS